MWNHILYNVNCIKGFINKSLTGQIPFSGNSYREIVMRNMKGIVDFDFKKYKITVAEDSKIYLSCLINSSNGFVKSNA